MTALRQLHRVLRHYRAAAAREFAPAAGRQTDLQGLGPRRFYDEVAVRESGERRYAVTVDGAALRTPQRSRLELPTAALASAVAAEWAAQEGRIRPSSMPLTTLTSAALDGVPQFRDRIIASAISFLHTDTVCIRPPYPSDLVAHQDSVLGPLIDHFANAHSIPLNVARGALHAPQSAAAVSHFSRVLDVADPFSLAALDSATATAKSIVVAVAMRDGAIDPAAAIDAARSEERWQARVWGEVEGGHDMDDSDTLVRLSAADLIFRLVDLDPDAFEGT